MASSTALKMAIQFLSCSTHPHKSIEGAEPMKTLVVWLAGIASTLIILSFVTNALALIFKPRQAQA
jgi:hypothetical protein